MFEIAAPWVLLLLPLPVLVWFLMPRVKDGLPTALNVPFFDAMLGVVDKEKRSVLAQSSLMIPALIWALLILGLAGPRWVGEPKPIPREGYNIMMALDLSASMEIPDMSLNGRPVSRLSVVKRAAQQFVKKRLGDKIGLILFGTRAYVQTPLTYDKNNILMRLDDATPGLAGKTTSIGDAVGLAIKRLEWVPKKGRIIILLTDGANNSGVLAPLKAAELAKEDHIKMYTIGLGSDASQGGLAPDFFTLNASSDLDEETLEAMAKATGGRYFRATDAQSLNAIYQTISQLETVHQDQATIRPQKDYFSWCVGLALFLSFYWMAAKAGLYSVFASMIRVREAVSA